MAAAVDAAWEAGRASRENEVVPISSTSDPALQSILESRMGSSRSALVKRVEGARCLILIAETEQLAARRAEWVWVSSAAALLARTSNPKQ